MFGYYPIVLLLFRMLCFLCCSADFLLIIASSYGQSKFVMLLLRSARGEPRIGSPVSFKNASRLNVCIAIINENKENRIVHLSHIISVLVIPM